MKSKENKKLPINGKILEIDNHVAFLILPYHPTPEKTIPWVWYAPTLPDLPGNEEKWMFEKFLDEGIAIAGIDVGESSGNPEGRAVYSKMHYYLVNKYGLLEKACMLARSRGGLMLLNWAVENPNSICCIAGIYPVCNLTSFPGLTKACKAYNMSEEQLTKNIKSHNPIDRLGTLASASIPFFIIHGDSDGIVPLKDNSAELTKRYQQLGANVKLVVAQGQGHNMWEGFFQCPELVNFIITESKK